MTTYLNPLRTFRSTVEHSTTALEGLTDPEPGAADSSVLTTILGRLDGRLDWDALSEETVAQRREQFATIDRLLDGKMPGEVNRVGLLHADAETLRAQIESLEDSGVDLDLVDVDGGVIVR